MIKKYDAIVIGGGHNGLVNAAYLAKAGKKVLVLERRPLVGGATVTEEIYPGFKYSVFSYVVSLLRPEIIRDLSLAKHGLMILPLESTLTPLPDGNYLYRDGDPHQTRRNIAKFSPLDAEAYSEYGRTMHYMAMAVKQILSTVPPDPTSLHPKELMTLMRLAKEMLGMPQERVYQMIKLMTMSSVEFLEQWFESDPLIATLSASGIIGTFLGPRSPGSAYVLLHHYMGEIDGNFRAWGFAKGGTGSVATAIASAAKSFNAEIRTSAAVEKVLVKNGKAVGVALATGEEIAANLVVSALDPYHTFIDLVDQNEMPPEILQAIKKFRFRGSSGKVNLALDRLPTLACRPEFGPHYRGAISISPNVDYLERAYDDAKYGYFSREPYMDIIIPSMIDPGMAPPGKHVMSCFVQYAPFELAEGSWDVQREVFGSTVIKTLSQYFPDIESLILHKQVLTPKDIEEITGLTQGNIFQGELSLSQLFFLRPVPGWAKYRTPIRGYYQCGSGTHPGGGIMGAPGRLAAMEILNDLKKGIGR
jgi:phytoene dehydrogenase-like protein